MAGVIGCGSFENQPAHLRFAAVFAIPFRAEGEAGMQLRGWFAFGIGIAAMIAAWGHYGEAREQMKANDPWLWLEDVHGARPLTWVRQENARTLEVLAGDPDYRRDYDAVLSILDAEDRIPFGDIDRQYVFNFWQDQKNPKGVWRGATIADYETANPHWETLLDLDGL